MTVDIPAWRAAERARLMASRVAMPAAERARHDERINEMLFEAFRPLIGRAIGFYWPMRGECDVRPVAARWHESGSCLALPAVVKKDQPLAYSRWSPGCAMGRDAFGVPVPQDGAAVRPDALLVPPVGFDEAGYRLGHGTAYVDRTLAGLDPQPIRIAVGREVNRMPTIHPQPHDIPMDFVVTERGVHEVTAAGLRLVQQLGDVAGLVERIMQARR